MSLLDEIKLLFTPTACVSRPLSQRTKLEKTLKVEKIVKDSFDHWNGPLCLLFEGARTNGLGVLKPKPNLIAQTQAICASFCRNPVLLCFSYPQKGYYTPINTTKNAVWHFICVLTNFFNTMRLTSKEVLFASSLETEIQSFYTT